MKIQGAGRILLYTDGEIRISLRCSGPCVRVRGRGLSCSSYNMGAVGIHGDIRAVDFFCGEETDDGAVVLAREHQKLKADADDEGDGEKAEAGVDEGGMAPDNYFLADSLNHAHAHLAQLLRPGDVVLYENDLPDNFK